MNMLETLQNLLNDSGFVSFFADGGWKNLVMIAVSCLLLYLGIKKQFEPLLLVGIAFGCLLVNVSNFFIDGASSSNALYHPELWSAFLEEGGEYYHSYGHIMANGGLLDILYIGVKSGLYPSLIFLGIGAMTDFGPLLSSPKNLLLGAAAQMGVFLAFFGAVCLGFDGDQAASIGIIGGTGSSKSSLVNLISRLYDVSAGAVYVGGKDVRSYDLDTLRNEVSVVLQNNVLFSGSIYDNLRWGNPDATDEQCRHACDLACASEFINRFPDGYNTHIEQGGSNVSGGQKQRLCIARALLKNPKILILDDSTSAVDTATDAKIRKAFAEEIPNTTKLIIAQRISSVMNADRIIVLNNGVVDGFGSHEELMETNAIYREVYESQTQGSGDFDEGGAK